MKKNFTLQLCIFVCIAVGIGSVYTYSAPTTYFPKTNRIIGTNFSEQRRNYLQNFQEEAFCVIRPGVKILASILEDTEYRRREFEIFPGYLDLSRQKLSATPIPLEQDGKLSEYCHEPIIIQVILRSPRGEVFRIKTFTDNSSPECHMMLAVQESFSSQTRGSVIQTLSTGMFIQKQLVVDKNFFVLATKQEDNMLERDVAHLPECSPNIRLKK